MDNKVITQETSLLYIYEYRRQYKSLHLFTRSCGQLLHKQPRRIELKKEGKPPSFKGSGEQEVIPDWPKNLQKRKLQSYFGMFRKELTSSHKLRRDWIDVQPGGALIGWKESKKGCLNPVC